MVDADFALQFLTESSCNLQGQPVLAPLGLHKGKGKAYNYQ